MTTNTKPVDSEALRLERDRRWDAGETIEEIDADLRTRGIDPGSLGNPKSALERPETAGSTGAAAGVRSSGDRGSAAQRRPTEAEIREAIDERLTEMAGQVFDQQDDLGNALERVAITAAAPIVDYAVEVLEGLGHGGGWEPMRDVPAGLWRDLRPSEALRLRELMSEASRRAADRARTLIVDELVAAAMTFEAEYPDAPRGRYWIDER